MEELCYEGTCEAKLAEPTQVNREMAELAQVNQYLRELVVELGQKLTPILSQENPRCSSDEDAMKEVVLCTHASEIKKQRNTVLGTIELIRGIHADLQI